MRNSDDPVGGKRFSADAEAGYEQRDWLDAERARMAGAAPKAKHAGRWLAFTTPFILLWLLAGCGAIQNWQESQPGIRMSQLQAANGWRVALVSSAVPGARQLAVTPDGSVFVGSESSVGKVYWIRRDSDGFDAPRVILEGLTRPAGIAFLDGALFVSDRTRILRYDDILSRLESPPLPTVVIDGFPDADRHSAHVMNVGPDNRLYVAVGSPCNVCKPEGDEYGTIIRIDPKGAGKEVVARGIRNSVGFDWHPQTKMLWFTDNGQDQLGAERPDDELNRVAQTGAHFGFPYCHGNGIPDPEFGRQRACSEFTMPALGLGAHVAALGMEFIQARDGTVSIIIARHGSHPPLRVGYDVVRVVGLDGAGQPRIEPFLTGFKDGDRFWGRPVDVVQSPRGELLISDDMNGAVYRMVPISLSE